MRCHKCGYISFDHLSECKKCGVDLVATRDKLGLAFMKPSEPFLLGSLIKDNRSDARTELLTPSGSPRFETQMTDIELAPDTSLDLEFADIEERESSEEPESFPGQARVRDQLSSARKVLEDIDSPRRPDLPASSGRDMELDLDAVLEAATAEEAREPRAVESEALEPLPEDMEIALSMEDLDQFMEDSGPPETVETQPRTVSYSSPSRDDGSLELIIEDEPPKKPEDEMTIELTSGDLDDLLQELEESTGGKEKKGKDQP